LVVESAYDTCRVAVDQAFGVFPVKVYGKKVAVKVNALKPGDPDQLAYVTHYKLVEAVVQRVAYRPVFSLERCRHEGGCTACVDICP
jgi:uncharacterized protein (DUF362 family)